MVHSEKDVLDWLLAHCQHDRVLYNALTNHSAEPVIDWVKSENLWFVRAVKPLSGHNIHICVVPHAVTREPYQYYRLGEDADA
jgi:hypothetical protein